MKKIICLAAIMVVIITAIFVSYSTIYDNNVTPKQNEEQVQIQKVEPVKIDVATKEEIEIRYLKQCAKEYPTATKIWKYMRYELDWSPEVCAGVMGNLMAECGGQTLQIDPYAKSPGYYGICQWSSEYYPDVIGTDLDYQLKFLKGTVESEFNTYGYLYGGSGFGYKSFKQIERPEDAALAFAECYERCSSKTYYIREENSLKAYSYFTNY